jgi:aspartyl-tRNA(Asn)/glutamyl-tRNA(Gln) amidotransferase subunit A
MMHELCGFTASQLLAMYRSAQVSPVDVTRAVLQRIDQVNGKLNAFCLVDAAQAMESAKASEQRWQAHRQQGAAIGALDGIPVSIKDLILTRGWPTLRGSRTVDPSQPWEVDAPVTARLRESGAVLLGKTTTPELGCKGETNSPLHGITRNPWNLSRTPGGSSGGAAAAVAAGMGPLAVGTDGAGSVRIPAAFCGNVGIKPSFGRVPAYPLSPFGTVAHLGPHTMSVTDAALMMNVMSLPDARDWSSLPYQPIDYTVGLNDGIRGLRIAYSPTLGYAKVDPDVAHRVDEAVRDLEALGARVVRCDPGFADPLDIMTGIWFAVAHQVWSAMTPAQQAVTDPDFQAEAEIGAHFSFGDVHKLNLRRAELGSQMRQFMQQYDLLVTPTLAIPAFEARAAGHSKVTAEQLLGWTPFSYPFNLTQQPAITIPCGLTPAGLPVGLQLVGPMFGDALVLRAARAYESLHPVPRPPESVLSEAIANA